MLSTKNLRFSYQSDHELKFPDIKLSSDEQLLMLGPSGAGKSTLLHLLAGILRPQEGSIWINQTEITRLSTNKMDHFRGLNIGLIFQRPHFVSALTIGEHLELVRYLVKSNKTRHDFDNMLDSMGILGLKSKKPSSLSIGEQQRAAIAIALVNTPGVILADEPTSSLDDENCDKVISLLMNQAALSKSSLVLITHDHRVKGHFQKSLML